jgi:guanylate kinase
MFDYLYQYGMLDKIFLNQIKQISMTNISRDMIRSGALRDRPGSLAVNVKMNKHWDDIKMYVFTGPSGSGKSTIIKMLFESEIAPYLARIVSTTTRPPAKDEVEGVDYHFVSKEEFLASIKKGDFFEYKKYSGNDQYYGMKHQHMQQALETGRLVINDLEVFGAREMVKYPHVFCQYIHVDQEVLEERLLSRNRENKKDLEKRLLRCKYDAAFHLNFDEEFDNTNSSRHHTFFHFYSRIKEMEIVKRQMPNVPHPVIGQY